MTDSTLAELKKWQPRGVVAGAWAAVLAVVLFTYLDVFEYLGHNWSSPDYGHCYFVPLFALFLLWYRRDMLDPDHLQGSWWALAFFAAWALLRLAGVYFAVLVWGPLSLIPFVAGLVVFVAGWRGLRWAWQSIVFLVFMLPLPGFAESFLRSPLQRISTVLSVYVIQTLGMRATDHEIVIELPNGPLNVAEACSGLRMLMLFFAVCVGAAFVMRRTPLWERLVVAFSSLPIAIVANVIRITVTALIHEWFTLTPEQLTDIHEWVGIVIMMPAAMLLLWGELAILHRLLIESVTERPLVMSGSLAGTAPAAPRAAIPPTARPQATVPPAASPRAAVPPTAIPRPPRPR